MGTAIVLLGTIAAGLAGTSALYRVFQNFQPGKQKITRDYNEMQAELRPLQDELVPVKSEELELLSSNQINKSRKKRVTIKSRGVFISIYQEPMIAWAMRKYLGSEQNALILARTARYEFLLRVRSKQTEISVNGKIGLIHLPDGRLFDGKGKKMLGFIRKTSDTDPRRTIYVGDRELAALQLLPETSSPQPRIFNFVQDEMTEEEKILLLAMSISYLTQHLA
ncbi:MAG: hypothetical protein KDC34_10530 [Saprospiraceae bacterium]|nr:hypothetical protein [Saprospiraceae bacterium]